jgi:putative transcriptional regulator
MDSLQGRLLIASPKLADPNFFRTVVLLVRHNDEGAMGVVLNRPADLTVEEVWAKVSETDCNSTEHIRFGGPCPGPLIALHARPHFADFEVMPGLFFTATPESLQELVGDGDVDVRFFAGYAGWGPGQLENEINAGAWAIAATSHKQVFDADDKLWESLVVAARRKSGWLADALKIKHVPPEVWMN